LLHINFSLVLFWLLVFGLLFSDGSLFVSTIDALEWLQQNNALLLALLICNDETTL